MAKSTKSLTETLMEELRHGTAAFEIVGPKNAGFWKLPFASICSVFSATSRNESLFYARMESPRQGTPPALKKVEHYAVHKVSGDGRCMFRSLVKGMALNKGIALNPKEEEEDADELRMAVSDAICRSDKERRVYQEALIAITVEESLKRYCQRIQYPDFWGGESELLEYGQKLDSQRFSDYLHQVLSKMCSQPIIVYIPESEAKHGKWGTGFIPIAEYGVEFMKPSKERKARKPVRLLYSGSNHYDLLI